MLERIRKIENVIVFVLLIMMLFTVVIATIELGVIVYQQLMKAPKFLLNLDELLEIMGFFLMVLIALELLATIKAYFQNKPHLEVVVIVAMIAIARKVIIVDYKETSPTMLFGMAAVIFALSAGYFLVKRAWDTTKTSSKGID